MNDLELTDDPPIMAQNGAETRRKALFLFARNDGFALSGNDREQISTMLDYRLEADMYWEAYIDDLFERMEREALLRGEKWDLEVLG
jgi:hypothetical protein